MRNDTRTKSQKSRARKKLNAARAKRHAVKLLSPKGAKSGSGPDCGNNRKAVKYAKRMRQDQFKEYGHVRLSR